MEGVAILEGEVRELIRRRGLDPLRDVDGIRALVDDAIADYDERSLHGAVPALTDPDAAAHAIVTAVAGFGPLQALLDDDSIEEIWINSPRLDVRAGQAAVRRAESAGSPRDHAAASLEANRRPRALAVVCSPDVCRQVLPLVRQGEHSQDEQRF